MTHIHPAPAHASRNFHTKNLKTIAECLYTAAALSVGNAYIMLAAIIGAAGYSACLPGTYTLTMCVAGTLTVPFLLPYAPRRRGDLHNFRDDFGDGEAFRDEFHDNFHDDSHDKFHSDTRCPTWNGHRDNYDHYQCHRALILCR